MIFFFFDIIIHPWRAQIGRNLYGNKRQKNYEKSSIYGNFTCSFYSYLLLPHPPVARADPLHLLDWLIHHLSQTLAADLQLHKLHLQHLCGFSLQTKNKDIKWVLMLGSCYSPIPCFCWFVQNRLKPRTDIVVWGQDSVQFQWKLHMCIEISIWHCWM